MRSDFIANHLLRNDSIAHARLEVLPGNALRLSGFLQIVERIEMVLLTHVVELLYQLGLTGNVELLSTRKKKLLVDQIAKQILLLLKKLLLRPLMLLCLLLQVLYRLVVIRRADHLIIDPGNNLFYWRSGIGRLTRLVLCVLGSLTMQRSKRGKDKAGHQKGEKSQETGRSKSKNHVF